MPLNDVITFKISHHHLTPLYCESNFIMNFGRDDPHPNHSKDSQKFKFMSPWQPCKVRAILSESSVDSVLLDHYF